MTIGYRHGTTRPHAFRPIIPTRRKEPFDDDSWVFEVKWDGFRGLADTVNGRMLSKNGNPLTRYRSLLDTLPPPPMSPMGKSAFLTGDGRPAFTDLLFRHREPVYVAFDVLVANGEDIRCQPLKERRAMLDRLAMRYDDQKSPLFFGCGKSLFRAVFDFDLEGVIAKRLTDAYEPGRTKWWKILNPRYSQKEGRGELFDHQGTVP